MKVVKTVIDSSYKLIESFSMIMVLAMTLIITGQVFCRYFLHFTPGWTEEVARVLLIWITNIGFSIGVYKGLHLSIELFVRNLPRPMKKVIYIFDEAVIVFFGCVIAKYGIDLVLRMGGSTLPATQWPGGTMYAMVPVSGIFMTCYAIYNMFYVDEKIDEMQTIEIVEVQE